MAIRFRIAKGALLGLAVMLALACTAQNPSDSSAFRFGGKSRLLRNLPPLFT